MMYNLSNVMKNEIVKQLDEMCADSTNIEITKYELFKAARNKVNDIVNYRNVRNEVRTLIEDYLMEHNYSYTINWNGKYNEYFITTEVNEIKVNKISRGRILISKALVEAAGLHASDSVVFEIYATADYDEYFYIYNIQNADLESKWVNYCGSIRYTVEKSGCIRLTAHPLDDMVTIKSGAGYIVVQ